MPCSCGGGTAGDEYQAVGPDGTVLQLAGGKMSGTADEARAAVKGSTGAWVRKVNR